MLLERIFKLKENKTTISTEIIAGLTTFFAMSYIIVVAPSLLSQTGMEWGAVFLATIIASICGTLIMAFLANLPLAQAAGMGLMSYFVYTICFALDFTWQQALSMVFICGLINIFITVTSIRRRLILAIPKVLKDAISCGIGIFVIYVGILNAGLIQFEGVPSLAPLNTADILVFLFAFVVSLILIIKKVKGALIIGIAAGTVAGIPLGVTAPVASVTFADAFASLPTTFGAIFTAEGLPSLFSDVTMIPLVLITILSFSLCDIFETVGTLIGSGRKVGLFSDADLAEMETSRGFSTKTDRALLADVSATTLGAIFGSSNVTTFVESSAGIAEGGRTGLTGVVVAICFLISVVTLPFASSVPLAATSPALIIVGCMMLSVLGSLGWEKLETAIPCFFISVFMALCYSIAYGVAVGFIIYCLVHLIRGEAKKVHPIIWVFSTLFVLNFVVLALF